MSFWNSTRIVLKRLPSRDQGRTPGDRARPELVVLGVRPGCTPSPLPPVRIFVGTELAQHRAERIFVYSIERVRDPARVYEIHLMKELEGFDRRRWLTGFSNYRFAIPELAGGTGRAIYNDVDQIYLRDPAELFDLDLGDHGYLATTATETSVMLMDCARMVPLWNLAEARGQNRKDLVARAADTPGLFGPLAPEWNAFDEAYVRGQSKVLHFTTLHTQPWQPFPERFVYQKGAFCEPWYELERAADAAGFQVFTRAQPSARFRALAASSAAAAAPAPVALASDEAALLDADVTLVGAESVAREVLTPASCTSELRSDAVVSTAGLDRIPVADAPWVVEGLFARARKLVWVRLEACGPAAWPLDLASWERLFRSTGLRHPDVRWCLVAREAGALTTRAGGRLFAAHPLVWVLTSNKGGDTSMSLGLAQELGVEFVTKALRFTHLARPHKRTLGRLAGALSPRWLGLDVGRSDALAPPWPDIVIATGWRPAVIAQWIKRRSGGRTRLVQMGRKAGQLVDRFDAVVACKHFGLPQHPARIETLLPLNRVTDEVLAHATARWPALFEGARRPRVVLLVGGTTDRHRLDAETAWRMASEVSAFAAGLGGSVQAVTSRRTGAKATEALVAGLGYAGKVHRFQAGQADNPYFAFLAQADVLVVTGESESMLAEAAAVGKPLFIYPLPQRSANVWTRLNDWMVYRAHFRPFKKGAEERRKRRHQQGLEYLLAKGLQHGWILPRRDTEQLNQALVQSGLAHFFGEPLGAAPAEPLREAREVAPRVRDLLGLCGEQDERAAELTPRASARSERPHRPHQVPG